jgi:predicted alpha/beta-hydrolase family hydrolase
MRAWEERLSALAPVLRFDYAYMQAGRRRPDPLERLIEAHRLALQRARAEYGPEVILAGKSMGSRIGCHVACIERVAALICFGYPLRAAGSGQLRDRVLLELTTPVLFVQGTRDPLCPLELLDAVRSRMSCATALHVVEGGDHSLRVTRRELQKSAFTQADVDRAIVSAIKQFFSAQVRIRSGAGAAR